MGTKEGNGTEVQKGSDGVEKRNGNKERGRKGEK